MYVKLTNDQVHQFPYTVGQFRRDNPSTSFPKDIPVSILKSYGVHPVVVTEEPSYDSLTQDASRDVIPHREVLRARTEEDATDPFTGEIDKNLIGTPIYGPRWLVDYKVTAKPEALAKANVRSKRDRLLLDTDWMALSDNTLTEAWATYRTALRDLTDQEGFPFSVVWPERP